jgi:AcrR family transcriptional regulator
MASTGTGAGPAPAAGPADGNRPLRSDAERNRRRILRAAAEVFTERDLDATLDDVACHAGVGVGTVYRRFPRKDALVEDLFTERIDALVRDTEKASAAPDPWTGLTWYLEHVAETFSGDIGFRQMMMFRYPQRRLLRVCTGPDTAGGDPPGRAGPGRRTRAPGPVPNRHPVHCAHGDQYGRARARRPPRRVAPLPRAGHRRAAPRAAT